MAEKITGLLGDYRPVNERLKDVPGAVRRYMQKSLLLDQPEMTGSETAADIALGFVPGLGTAMGARDFERARREGDGLGMALGAVGLLPVVGGVGALAKKGGKKVAKVVEDALPDELKNFGNKQVQEARTRAKVDAMANQAPVENPRPAQRGAVEPRKYRTMAQEEGDDAVLRAATRGEHLRDDGSGGLIGAPRHITRGSSLGAYRRRMDDQIKEAADAVGYAERTYGDEARVGTWYPRAKQGMADSSLPSQIDTNKAAHSVYSAGVSPETELAFALKHGNSRAIGDPVMAYRTAAMNKLDDAAAAGVYPKLADKVSEYGEKIDPRVPIGGLFGVNDFRNAQGFEYTTPNGDPWKGGSPQQCTRLWTPRRRCAQNAPQKAVLAGLIVGLGRSFKNCHG